MILIISTCKETLSELEFVKPLEQIVKKNYRIHHYSKVQQEDLEHAQKIIISGTALQDNEYLKHLNNFNWLKKINKPVLGICAGSQILGLQHHAKLIKKKEIGIIEIKTIKENPLCRDTFESYTIHQNSLTHLREFEIIAQSNKTTHIFKHKTKSFYGVMFHPEVKNKEIINTFLSL